MIHSTSSLLDSWTTLCLLLLLSGSFTITRTEFPPNCMYYPDVNGTFQIPQDFVSRTLPSSQTRNCGLFCRGNAPLQFIIGMSATTSPTNDLTLIVPYAFHSCGRLQRVQLPATVTTIGMNAFGGCVNLAHVQFSSSLQRIDNSSFEGCSSLQNITLPNSVTVIDSCSFQACTALRNVLLSNSLTYIGRNVFYACNSIVAITIPPSVKYVGLQALPNCYGFGLRYGNHSITLEQTTDFPTGTVDCIACNDSMATLRLRDSVVSIQNGSLFGCSKFVHAILPDGLQYIGSKVFAYCSALQSVYVPSSIIFAGTNSLPTCLGYGLLISSLDPKYVLNGTNVTCTPCHGSPTLTFPNESDITAIGGWTGDQSFSSCTSLVIVSIPQTVTLIGNSSFLECSELLYVDLGNVQAIGPNCFQGCTELVDVRMSPYITYIGQNAFQDCTSLQSVDFPVQTESNTIDFPINIFSGCSLCGGSVLNTDDDDQGGDITPKTSVVVQAFVASFTFYACKDLVGIYFTDAVLRVLPRAVIKCDQLTSINVPNSVTYIHTNAFTDCGGLKSITIPNTTTVEQSAFTGCGCDSSLYTAGSALQNCQQGFINATGHWTEWTTCNITQFQYIEPTYYRDRQCQALTNCEGVQHGYIKIEGTPTSNRVCDTTPLLSGLALYMLIGFVVLMPMCYIAWKIFRMARKYRHAKYDLILQERLLAEERAENIELKRAWEIDYDDLNLQTKLASGASGTVWKARWGHNVVAVKMINHTGGEHFDPFAEEDFNREVSMLQRIRHPNLVVFYGAGCTPSKQAFIVVEYMSEGSLQCVLASNQYVLTPATSVGMALDCARGMRHLHSLGSVHRDLKSPNCLVSKDLHVKVADFGTSRLVSRGQKLLHRLDTNTSAHSSASVERANQQNNHVGMSSLDKCTLTAGVGTLLWSAPEVLGPKDSFTDYGQEADVFSFGMVMYELLTRKFPWELDVTETSDAQFFAAVRESVMAGQRPTIPTHAVPGRFPIEDIQIGKFPVGYIQILNLCWSQLPADRPTFADVVSALESVVV